MFCGVLGLVVDKVSVDKLSILLLSTCQLVNLFTCQLVNLLTYQLVNLSPC